MDIYCRMCGEPWDMDSLHEEVLERTYAGETATFRGVLADFQARGCAAIGGRCNSVPILSAQSRELVGIAYEFLGDDVDGAASLFEDWGMQ